MDHPPFPFVFVILVIGCGIVAYTWQKSRSLAILRMWADENGFDLLRSERCLFFRGPFFLRSAQNQPVYYVRVRDRQGRERSGWVRCGGWFLGLMSNAAEVRRED